MKLSLSRQDIENPQESSAIKQQLIDTKVRISTKTNHQPLKKESKVPGQATGKYQRPNYLLRFL